MTSATSGATSSVISAVTDTNGKTTNANATLADNFQTFLTLLTAQLQNQNPLDPLDTNQFTQQLVQFAQVEQQLKSNDQLATLVGLQQSIQTSQAMDYIGRTVVLDGQTAALANGRASWSFNANKPASATINIRNAAGANVYSGTFALQTGTQNFVWDGRNKSGVLQPDGAYTMSITATDASGQSVAVATEIQGLVEAVDLSKNPPLLSVGGKDYTADKVRRIVSPSS
jgi:flagellar basal-body rod modification protein FlgD